MVGLAKVFQCVPESRGALWHLSREEFVAQMEAEVAGETVEEAGQQMLKRERDEKAAQEKEEIKRQKMAREKMCEERAAARGCGKECTCDACFEDLII